MFSSYFDKLFKKSMHKRTRTDSGKGDEVECLMQKTQSSDSQYENYSTYSSRFYILLLYCSAITTSSTLRLSFSAIIDYAALYWNQDWTAIDWLVTLCYLVYPLGSAVGEAVQAKQGFCAMIILGSGLSVLGAFFRLLSCLFSASPLGYGILLLGQITGAIGLPPLLNGGGTIANNWFSVKERDSALAATVVAYYLGFSLTYFFSVFFVSEGVDGSIQGMRTFMFFEFLINVVTFIWMVFSLKEHPPTPPSYAAANKRKINEEHKIRATMSNHSRLDKIFDNTFKLVGNQQYLILVIGISILSSTYQAVYGLIDEFAAVSNYTDGESAVLAVSYTVSGMVAIALYSLAISGRIEYFPTLLKVLLAGACVFGVGFVYLMYPGNFTCLVIASSLFGLFVMPLVPVVLALIVECTYPLEESFALGFTKSICYLSTVFMLATLHRLIQLVPKYIGLASPANILVISCFVLSGTFLFVYKPDLQRHKADLSKCLTPGE